jgi:hypothetical protein
MSRSTIKPTARVQAAQQGGNSLGNASFRKRYHEAIDLSTQTGSSFKDTPVGVGPTAPLQKDLLHDHGTELAIEFTQNAKGFTRTPFVDFPSFFPQAKKAFNLPAQAQEHDDLKTLRPSTRQIGQQNQPLGQIEHFITGFLALFVSHVLTQAFLAFPGNLFGHPDQD